MASSSSEEAVALESARRSILRRDSPQSTRGPGNCGHCGSEGATQWCSRCKVVSYCGQKRHWREHKVSCRPYGTTVSVAAAKTYDLGVRLYGDEYKSFADAASSRRNVDGARVGIRNEGNTCYLSSVVQALTYSPLANWVLEIDPVGDAPTKAGFNLMFELAKHVRKVWALNHNLAARDDHRDAKNGRDENARRRRAPPPSTADISIGKTLLKCSGHAGRMEDAHECLTYVLAMLLEACGVGYDGEKNEKWEKSTLVYEVFGLDLAQSVVCCACNHASKTPSSEMALRLNATLGLSETDMASATRIDDALERRLHSRATGFRDLSEEDSDEEEEEEEEGPMPSPPTSIEELLKHFFATEKIDDFECEKCKKRGHCEKRGGFASLPNSLSLYVDRIPVFGALFGKSNRVVSFDRSLDLAPFLAAAEPQQQTIVRDDTVYYLYALVAHLDFSGSTFFGHYISYVRDGNDVWWLLDDESVQIIEWDQVKRVNPYLLFYSKGAPEFQHEESDDDQPVEECNTVVITPRENHEEEDKGEDSQDDDGETAEDDEGAPPQGTVYTDVYEMD